MSASLFLSQRLLLSHPRGPDPVILLAETKFELFCFFSQVRRLIGDSRVDWRVRAPEEPNSTS